MGGPTKTPVRGSKYLNRFPSSQDVLGTFAQMRHVIQPPGTVSSPPCNPRKGITTSNKSVPLGVPTLERSLLVPMASGNSRPLHHPPVFSREVLADNPCLGVIVFWKSDFDCDWISTLSGRHHSMYYLPHPSTPDKSVREYLGRVQSATLLSSQSRLSPAFHPFRCHLC